MVLYEKGGIKHEEDYESSNWCCYRCCIDICYFWVIQIYQGEALITSAFSFSTFINSSLREIDCGKATVKTSQSGSITTVNFNKEFSQIPKVFLSKRNTSVGGLTRTNAVVSEVTTTNFKVLGYYDNSTDSTLSVDWFAII